MSVERRSEQGGGDALLPMLEHLARPGRLAVFRSVLRAGVDGITRERLVRVLRTTGSALTFHLRALAEVRLIHIRVTPHESGEGRTIHCTAAPQVLADAVSQLLDEGGPQIVAAKPPVSDGASWSQDLDCDRRLD